MKKPVLVIMAAGMGSRYGGLKQMDPVDPEGNLIIDFSIYDAVKAGFSKVVFVIKRELEADFRSIIGDRVAQFVPVEYVYQQLDAIPHGVGIPEGRVKPWGTGHAVLCCKEVIDGPFAVINADDYYGASAFEQLCRYLEQVQDGDRYQFAMVGYRLANTLTDNGHVARGVCRTDENGQLLDIQERTRIEWHGEAGAVAFTEDEGQTWNDILPDTTVSMNMWGFSTGMLEELERRFPLFLTQEVPTNPLKSEFFLPTVVDQLIKEEKAQVKVLKSMDRWYGVTYKEDKGQVMEAIEGFKRAGLYPRRLWEEEV